MIAIPGALQDALVAQARDQAPNECCGLLELDAASMTVLEMHPMKNIAASPMRFELGSTDLLRLPEIEASGRTPVIYHSHTDSEAVPSQTDLNFANNWPGVPWLIIGLHAEVPVLRWYEIDEGAVQELQVARADG